MYDVTGILKTHGILGTTWAKAIVSAEEAGGFTYNDVELASSWTTCACGSIKEEGISRGYKGVPTDYRLRKLGEIFYRYVRDDQMFLAAITLINIQERAASVLEEARGWELSTS